MKNVFAKNKAFFIPFCILWLGVGVLLLIVPKANLHLFINNWHGSTRDIFFKYITNLGDGLAPAIIAVLFIFFGSFRNGFILGGGAIIGGVMAQTLKHTVFSDVLRPKAFFNNVAELYFIDGVEVHSFFSFPSGHSTTAFGLFFVFAWMAKKNPFKIIWLICALVVAFSRVYLSQHFLIDIYFGAFLGIFSSIIAITIFSVPQNKWMDKSLYKLIVR